MTCVILTASYTERKCVFACMCGYVRVCACIRTSLNIWTGGLSVKLPCHLRMLNGSTSRKRGGNFHGKSEVAIISPSCGWTRRRKFAWGWSGNGGVAQFCASRFLQWNSKVRVVVRGDSPVLRHLHSQGLRKGVDHRSVLVGIHFSKFKSLELQNYELFVTSYITVSLIKALSNDKGQRAMKWIIPREDPMDSSSPIRVSEVNTRKRAGKEPIQKNAPVAIGTMRTQVRLKEPNTESVISYYSCMSYSWTANRH